jgi:hypothetical protein
MAFGKRKGGGDILPLLKFDARVGRFYTETRVQTINGWEKEQSDVTDRLRMTVDLANVAVGWIRFPRGAPPETALVAVGARTSARRRPTITARASAVSARWMQASAARCASSCRHRSALGTQ